jgi:ABC-type transport system substrate-binding protein
MRATVRLMFKGLGVFVLVVIALGTSPAAELGAQGPPDGQLTIAFDASIAPSFLDPAEMPGIATPMVFLYALHDALVKPLPGNNMAPCLAESWKESPDGLVYEFKLREGLKFQRGAPPRVSRASSSALVPMRTAGIPRSTICTVSSRTSATGKSARRSCTRSSA